MKIILIHVAQKSQLNDESQCADNVNNIYTGEHDRTTGDRVEKSDYKLMMIERKVGKQSIRFH